MLKKKREYIKTLDEIICNWNRADADYYIWIDTYAKTNSAKHR